LVGVAVVGERTDAADRFVAEEMMRRPMKLGLIVEGAAMKGEPE
jgi:hypothetical protein